MLIHMERKRFPEFFDNVEALLEYMAKGERSFDYEDSSSLLIKIMFELYAIVNFNSSYDDIRSFFLGEINLQMVSPFIRDGFDLEQAFFGGNIYNEMFVETDIPLPEKFEELRALLKAKGYADIHYRTDDAGLPFLRSLPTIFYKNDIFPNEWRSLLNPG